MNVKDATMVGSPLTVKNKPKKRSLVERELETSLTERVTSPVTYDGGSTSRYGRTRRLKTSTDYCDTEKVVSKVLKSPIVESSPMKSHSPVYKMHASNSPVKMETPKKAISVGNNLENQIEHIYHENISLSRFGSEEKVKNMSQTKNFSKVYVRKDLIQRTEKEETASLMKNMFSPTKSNQKTNSHLNNILERSSEKYSLNINGNTSSKPKNGYLDTSSVVKTLDFDNSKKKRKDGSKLNLTKSEIFEMEAKCAYQVGDLAWARVGTYPFWPCIVTREPISGMFVRKKLFGRVEHDIIHVTFFGDNGRRGWIVDNMLRKYLGVLEFENTKEHFTVEDKKKDPKLYAAFFVSEKKLPLWNVSVEEAETLMREPKRLRIDIFNDLLEKSRSKAVKRASIKMSRTNSDVSLSESLFDTLFSEDDGKTEDQERSRSRSKNKALDVSEVVTACLDNMAAKTGITKIQRQSHMDRWLQKAKSKTPEKAQPKPSNQANKKFEKDSKAVSSKKKKKPSPKSSQTQIHYSFRKLNSQNNLTSFQNEHDYTFPNARRLDNGTDRYKTVDSNIDFTGSGIGFIAKVETLAGKKNDIFSNNSKSTEALVNDDCVIEQPHCIVEEIITDDYEVPEVVHGETENKELSQHNSIIKLPAVVASKVRKPRDRLRLNRTKKFKDNKVNDSLDVNNGNKETNESVNEILDIKEKNCLISEISLENGIFSLDKEVSKSDNKVDIIHVTNHVLLSAIEQISDLPKTYSNLDNEVITLNTDNNNKNMVVLTENSVSANNLNIGMQKLDDKKNVTDENVDSPIDNVVENVENVVEKSSNQISSFIIGEQNDIFKDVATNINLNDDVLDVFDNKTESSTTSIKKDKISTKSNIQTRGLNDTDMSSDSSIHDNTRQADQQTVDESSLNICEKDMSQKNVTPKIIDNVIMNGHDDGEHIKKNVFEYSADDHNDNTIICIKNHNQIVQSSAPNEIHVENGKDREFNVSELNTNLETYVENNVNEVVNTDDVIGGKTSEKVLNKMSSDNITIVLSEEIDNLDSACKDSVLDQQIEIKLIDKTVSLNESMRKESSKVIIEELINETKKANPHNSSLQVQSIENFNSGLKKKDLDIENASICSENTELLLDKRKTRSIPNTKKGLNESMQKESTIFNEETIIESNFQCASLQTKSFKSCDYELNKKVFDPETASINSEDREIALGKLKFKLKSNKQELNETKQIESPTMFNKESVIEKDKTKLYNTSLDTKSVENNHRELKKNALDPETASINSEDSEISLCKRKSRLKTNTEQGLNESMEKESATIFNKESVNENEEIKLCSSSLDTKSIENNHRELKNNELDPETPSINSEDSEISLCKRKSRLKTNTKQGLNDSMKKELATVFDEETINEKKIKNIQNTLFDTKSIETCELKRNELDPETASINSEDSEISYSRRKSRSKTSSRQGSVTMTKALEDPEFQQYLELRQDALIDENPQLTQEEIVNYLYKTWLYEESIKPETKKSDEQSLVKGLKQDSVQKPKKVKKKKVDKELLFDGDEIMPKEKPKRKLAKPFYNYDFSDIEDEIESFEIFSSDTKEVKKTESKISNKLEEQGNKAILVEESNEEVYEYEYDEEESYFDELTKPKPNVFKGTVREKVCEICERPTNLIKCKICLDMFHIDCTKKEIKVEDVSTPSRGRKKKKKTRGRRPRGLDDSNGLDSESQSDDKSQDANVSEDLNISFEEAETESHVVVDVAEFESHITKKMKEMLDQNLNYSYDSSDCEIDWDRTVPGKCEIVDIKLKSKNEINASLYPDFKCKNCETYNLPLCFVCKSAVSPKTKAEYRQKCQLTHCNKYFHLECLDHWPQTQLELSENNKFEPLTCPRHVCHTCVCDDPRGCKTRFSSDKLARCIRCPATYHCFSKCLPAGTQILTGSQIVCPRHYEHRPGKVPCHVNTGWCFICALGGTLICCEYCPTSFHAECLNIKPPEGSYMCEDCETGRLPLYGEMVWVKLGHYRWWPGIILHPSEIPSNIIAVKHTLGEFVVRFFGQYDHYWVNRGRVFPFQEGDSGKISSQKSKIDEAFTKAMEHAQRACEILKTAEPNSEESQELAQSLLPPQYVKLKSNKPVGRVAARRDDADHSLTQCECEPSDPDVCGPYTSCLNRMLLTECGPSCKAGDRCNNRQFEKRQYPKLVPYRTPHRGWGLKTLEDIKLGQFVIEYVGELISEEEFTRRMRRKHEIRDENFYFLTLDKERMIDAGPKGNLARFMNHCCEPNCETQKWTVLGDVRVGLFAMTDIPANSELTFNYNLESAGIEKKRCLCGAKRCSGYIGAKPKQDESQQKKSKGNIKKPNKKRKLPEELPSTTKYKPKSRQTSRSKPKELTEIEKDLLIIKNATNITSSDSECSERLSVEEKKQKALKRTAITDEFQVNSGSKRLKLDKCDGSDLLG